jgi:GNAT superfamily N-acetyltransferase
MGVLNPSPGEREIQRLLGSGFTPDEVDAWRVRETGRLLDAGFDQDEVDEFWGSPKPNLRPIEEFIAKNMEVVGAEDEPDDFGWLDALGLGVRSSVTGQTFTGKLAEHPPEDISTIEKMLMGNAEFLTDLPLFMLGGLGGALVTGAASPASPIAAGAGAFALPAALRQIQYDMYVNGEVDSASEFWDRVVATLGETLKGGTVGAATAGTGMIAARLGAGMMAKFSTEVGTLTGVGAAVEGRLPEPHEFVDAAFMLGTLKVGMHVVRDPASVPRAMRKTQDSLGNIYARYGKRPNEVVKDSTVDPSIKEDVNSTNHADKPRTYEGAKTPEPTPKSEAVRDAQTMTLEEFSAKYGKLEVVHKAEDGTPFFGDTATQATKRALKSGKQVETGLSGRESRMGWKVGDEIVMALDTRNVDNKGFATHRALYDALRRKGERLDAEPPPPLTATEARVATEQRTSKLRDRVDDIDARIDEVGLSKVKDKNITIQNLRNERAQIVRELEGGERAPIEFAAREEAKAESAPDRPMTEAERAELEARATELEGEIRPLAEKGNLTAEESGRFKQLTSELEAARFELQEVAQPKDMAAPGKETKSTLSQETNATAINDLQRNREVSTAVKEAAAGAEFNAETAIDVIMRGKNPKVSPSEFYNAFNATREALRAEHGDRITLYRAQGMQKRKPTTNWATTREFAAQFGEDVVSRRVPIDQVAAVHVSARGKYHEVVVVQPRFVEKARIAAAEPGAERVSTAIEAKQAQKNFEATDLSTAQAHAEFMQERIRKGEGRAGTLARALEARRLTDQSIGKSRRVQQKPRPNNFRIAAKEADGRIVMEVSGLSVPKALRKQEIGTEMMKEITAWADRHGYALVLTPRKLEGTTSVGRLERWFKEKHGFKKNKDASISETLVREPQGEVKATTQTALTDAELAAAEKAAAPKTGERKEREDRPGPPEPPREGPPPEPAGAGGGEPPKPGKMTDAEADAQIMSRISVGDKGPGQRWGLHEFYTEVFDRLHPIAQAVKAMSEGKPLSIIADAYRLARGYVGVLGKAQRFITDRTISYKTLQAVGKGLQEIWKAWENNMDPVRRYLISKRVLELHARGKKAFAEDQKPADIEAARNIVEREVAARKDGKLTPLEKMAEEIQAYQEDVLRYLKDSGVISNEKFAMFREMNQQYIPFYRYFEGVGPGAVTGAGPKAGGLGVRDPIRALVGNERQLVDPVESVMKNTYVFITIAEQNRVGRAFIELAEAAPDSIAGQFAVKAKRHPKKIEMSRADKKRFRHMIERDRKEQGKELTPEEVTKLEEFLETELNIFRPGMFVEKQGQIAVFRNGKKEIWDVSDPVYKAFSGMGGGQQKAFIKWLGMPARGVRAGSIFTPEFALRNLFRDGLSSYIFSKNGGLPFQNIFRGVWELAKKPLRQTGEAHPETFLGKKLGKLEFKNYNEWYSSGGPMSTIASMDRRYLGKQVEIMFGKPTGSLDLLSPRTYGRAARNIILHPIESLRTISNITEVASRVGDFSRTRDRLAKKTDAEIGKMLREGKLTEEQAKERRIEKETESILEAGFESREVIIDFGRMGASIEGLNQTVAFFNPTLQGADKLARQLDPRNPKQALETTAKIFASIVLPTVGLHFYNRNDPDYRRLPKWQRDMFWIFPVGEGEDKTFVRLPKPFEAGMLFGTGTERLMDEILTEHPDAFDDYAGAVFRATTPSIVPTFLVPFIETFSNRSIFLDRPIIPRDREELLPELQYNPYTKELTKWFAGLFAEAPGPRGQGIVPHSIPLLGERGIMRTKLGSPAIVENWLRVWTGGLGMHALNGFDAALRAVGMLPDPPRPADTLSDIPVVKAFVVRYPAAGAEPIQQFYEEFSRAEEIRRSIKFLISKEMDIDRAMALQQQFDVLPSLSGIRSTLAANSRLVRMIWKMPDSEFGPQEKRQLIDETYARMILLAEHGLEIALRHNEALKRYEQ